jgi:hypothetical protein
VPAAVQLGLRSQLAVRLYLDDDGVLGGLNLYSTTSDEVDPEAEATAELFAAHAAIALHNARERENLDEALRSRKVIGQALGILMESATRWTRTGPSASWCGPRPTPTSSSATSPRSSSTSATGNDGFPSTAGSAASPLGRLTLPADSAGHLVSMW